MKTILFDLDGTLLPMNQETFVRAYFGGLSKHMLQYGYKPDELIDAIWKGTAAMLNNDGSELNETVFWKKFTEIFGEKSYADVEKLEEFYKNDFGKIREVCSYTPRAAEMIEYLLEKGVRLALATNPIFPRIATKQRIEWAGLTEEYFALVTTYENIGTCKPNPAYYREILSRLGGEAEDYLMIGNDVTEDGAAAKIGIDVFILTDYLINKEGRDLSELPHGDFDELKKYIDAWLDK